MPKESTNSRKRRQEECHPDFVATTYIVERKPNELTVCAVDLVVLDDHVSHGALHLVECSCPSISSVSGWESIAGRRRGASSLFRHFAVFQSR
ncbi:hypothetical protein PsorP6_011334 [Peronosclerospora sorghi]|uniref:Uncharacterized protein n=1 Tax=Peronosclerospora sorghi TaxID=230839 RepID=A0ACC0WJE6_9STRA|nr:hypothetical protein PsorP6_011334 [Peronosclerospora sorghi]